VKIHFPSGWKSVQSRAIRNQFDLAVIDPGFGHRVGVGRPDMIALEELVEVAGSARVVFYVDPDRMAPRDLSLLGLNPMPPLILMNVDDHPNSLLRALLTANRNGMISRFDHLLRGRFGAEGYELLAAFTGAWPSQTDVARLCSGLGLSPRTLRRRFQRLGLPRPKEVLGWLQLLGAIELRWAGMSSAGRIARLVGRSDIASLAHLSKRLTGFPLGRTLAQNPREFEIRVVESLTRRASPTA